MSDLRRLLGYVQPYGAPLIGSIFLMAGAGLAHGMMALLIGPVFDRVLRPDAPDTAVELFRVPGFGNPVHLNDIVPPGLHDIWMMVGFSVLAVFLGKGLFEYAGTYLINYAGLSAVTDLRQAIFDKVLRQDAQFFETNSTGSLMSSIMSDVEKIQVAVSHLLADFLNQSFSVVFLLWVVLQKDWRLALVSITVLPFVLVPTARIGRRIRKTTRRAQDYAGELNQILQETITGHHVVKSFGTEDIESGRFQLAAGRLKASNLRYVLQQSIASPLIEFFAAGTIVGLLAYARTQIKAGAMTPGEFTSFMTALLLLYNPVKRLTGIHNIFQQALGASQRVFEYLDREQTIQDRTGARKLPRFQNGIRFQDVTFRYPSVEEGYTLAGINLDVNVGEIVALVGPSGAGKTTLANLAPRFYDVTGGAISIDGHDIRDVQLASLRSQISIVAQDTFLFNDTVGNNIRYGKADATEEEVRQAAAAALAEEFIQRLPQGYGAVIGERGLKLSGGQRQRIAIARALLKNAPILILDEATSHLDTESETLVQRALQNLMTHRTVIVIAHRLSTVRRADKIVVLDRGRIAETGTHDELVGRGGLYQRLHDMQFLTSDPQSEEPSAVPAANP